MYERLARGGRRAGFRELMATQLINALWHGPAPRYVAFFVHSVFFIQFSSVVSRLELLLPAAAARSRAWRAAKVAKRNLLLYITSPNFLFIRVLLEGGAAGGGGGVP